jgi:hypothetical protein
MYSNEVKQALKERIGFGSDEGISIDIDDALKIGTSERTASYFHKLVSIPNLYFSVPTVDMEKADFEEILDQLRTDAVANALTAVLHQSVDYVDSFDYDETIIEKISLFDDVIGYSLAISALEMMVSSNRKNDDTRNVVLSYQQLKVELEGVKNEGGHVISQGLNRKLFYAIRQARKIIFPQKIIVTSKPVW